MGWSKRRDERVDFQHDINAKMVGIDGTWHRPCKVIDVSSSGARLNVEGEFKGLNLKEFFLLFSETGLAFRRCELVRVDSNVIGVQFIKLSKSRKRQRQS